MFVVPGLIRTVGIKYIQKHHVLIYWLQNDMYLDLLYPRSLEEAFHFFGFVSIMLKKMKLYWLSKQRAAFFI